MNLRNTWKITPLGETTITVQLRIFGDIVRSSLPINSEFNQSDYKIVRLLTELDNEDPPGLFTLKRDTFSANYKQKIMFAFTQAIEFLAIGATETLQISENEKC